MESESRPEPLTPEPQPKQLETEAHEVSPKAAVAPRSLDPKPGTRDKRLAKDRRRAGNGHRIEQHEVRGMLKEFKQLEVSDQRQQVGRLLADTLGISQHLVMRVLEPTDTSRLSTAEASTLLKIRNAIGFTPNRKATGYEHFGLLPAIREITDSHDVNALLGSLLGFRFVVEGRTQEAAKRAVVTTGQQMQRMSAAMKSPRAPSPNIGQRYILQGLMIIGKYAEAAKATDAREAAS